MTDPTRILIADDHPLVREGLIRILAAEPDFEIVGDVEDGTDVVRICREQPVDVVLLDITMPGPGFLEIIARLRARGDKPAVLVLSMHPEEKYARRAITGGANGYLTKGQSPDVVVRAIRRVADGRVYLSEDFAEMLVGDLLGEQVKPPHEVLSRREFQVVQKLGAGQSLTEIATELSLSEKTVSTYRTRAIQKLGLRRTGDLIRYAIEQKLSE